MARGIKQYCSLVVCDEFVYSDVLKKLLCHIKAHYSSVLNVLELLTICHSLTQIVPGGSYHTTAHGGEEGINPFIGVLKASQHQKQSGVSSSAQNSIKYVLNR